MLIESTVTNKKAIDAAISLTFPVLSKIIMNFLYCFDKIKLDFSIIYN